MRFDWFKLRRLAEYGVTSIILASLLYGMTAGTLVALLQQAHTAFGEEAYLVLLALSVSAPTLAVLQRIGPLWATHVEVQWLDIPGLIRRRRRALLTSVLAALVLSSGLTASAAVTAAVDGAITGLVTAAAVALSAIAAYVGQHWDRPLVVRSAAAACAAAAAIILCQSAGMLPTAVLSTTLLYAASPSFRRLPGRHRSTGWASPPARWSLVKAGTFVEALRVSTVMLDGTALELLRFSEDRPERSPTPRKESGILLVRILTAPRVMVLIPALALPAGVEPAWGMSAAACVLVLATFVFTWRASGSLDAYLDSAALRRSFAARRRRIPALLAITTVGVTLAYSTFGAVAASLPLAWAPAASGFAVLGILRRRSGRRLAGRVGALLSTPAGAIPVDLGRRVLAGTDALILGLLTCATQPAAPSALVAVLGTLIYFSLFTARAR